MKGRGQYRATERPTYTDTTPGLWALRSGGRCLRRGPPCWSWRRRRTARRMVGDFATTSSLPPRSVGIHRTWVRYSESRMNWNPNVRKLKTRTGLQRSRGRWHYANTVSGDPKHLLICDRDQWWKQFIVCTTSTTEGPSHLDVIDCTKIGAAASPKTYRDRHRSRDRAKCLQGSSDGTYISRQYLHVDDYRVFMR